jgi:multidrug resistance efflux pump
LVALSVVAGIVVGGWWVVRRYVWTADEGVEQHLTHTVHRGDLVITVTEDGNVESAANIDIRCQVAGGATIKKIVLDGTIVKQGEELVELDSSAIDEQILTQKIAYEKARAVRDQALNDLQAAKISLREYVEGTFVKDLQTADANITVAQENLRSAQNTLDYTEKMFRKGYVTQLQQEAQEFAVKRAGLDLDLAQTAKKVLQEFTFAKMKNDLEALVATSEAKAKSEQAAFELEESKLKRLETQKINCIITAPQSGMVVYANESSGGRFGGSSDRPKIEEGATVRESQVILRVPDLAQMQVKVTVHESKVESLRVGMPASIRIQNRKLTGYVTSIANQPETTSMFSAGVKEYATYVRIDGEQTDLKPGMTAEVVILIDERKNVLTAPVQCVIEQRGKFYCWRIVDGQPAKTQVALGAGDDRQIEVREGLADGDVILQSPPERSEGNFSTRDGNQFGGGKRTGKGKGAGDEPSAEAPSAEGAPRPAGGGRNLMANDKDGDKRISRDEAPPQLQSFFDKIDTDGDGFISEGEAQAAQARMKAAGGQGGGTTNASPAGGQQ